MDVEEVELEGGAGAEALLRQFRTLGVRPRDEAVDAMRAALGPLDHHVAAFYLDMADWNLQNAIGCYLDFRSSPPVPETTTFKFDPPICTTPETVSNSTEDSLGKNQPNSEHPDVSFISQDMDSSVMDVRMAEDINTPSTVVSYTNEPCMRVVQGHMSTPMAMFPGVRFKWTWDIQNNGKEPWPEGCSLRAIGVNDVLNMTCKPVSPLYPQSSEKLTVQLTTPLALGIYHQQYRLCTPEGLPFGETLAITVIIERLKDFP